MKVAVVGAGVSGLQTGRALHKRGYTCTIFEARGAVSGLWTQCTHGQGAQVPFPWYFNSELPWPEHLVKKNSSQLPSAATIQEYWEEYVDTFGLRKLIQLNTVVISVARSADGKDGWLVKYQTGEQKSRTEHFDFVVLATGIFASPIRPVIQDEAAFKGTIILARDLTTENLHLVKGKGVVVIGGGKSAIDASGAASEVAESVVQLQRQTHAWLGLYVGGLVPFQFIGYTRLGVALNYFLPPGLSAVSRAIHTALFPLKWLAWRATAALLNFQFGFKGELVPKAPLEKDLFGPGVLMNSDSSFAKSRASGGVTILLGLSERFEAEGLRLRDGSFLSADVVIYAIGYERTYPFFSPELKAELGFTPEGLPLYRDTLHPRVQGLAWVGSELLTYNGVLSSGLQAEWLAAVLQGEVALPSVEAQEADVAAHLAWRRSFVPPCNMRAGLSYHLMSFLFDDMMRDLGFPARRKVWYKEPFEPYTSSDYLEVFEAPLVAKQLPAAATNGVT